VGKGQPAAMDVQRAVKVDKRCAYRLHSNLAPATSLPDNVLMSTAHSSIVPVHRLSRAAAVRPSAVVLIVQWFTTKIAAAISFAPRQLHHQAAEGRA
jgi:hypothetical protein